MQRLGKYVVYDPPEPGLPYLTVLFRPGASPKVFVFETYVQAVGFLTSNAIERDMSLPGDSQATRDVSPLHRTIRRIFLGWDNQDGAFQSNRGASSGWPHCLPLILVACVLVLGITLWAMR